MNHYHRQNIALYLKYLPPLNLPSVTGHFSWTLAQISIENCIQLHFFNSKAFSCIFHYKVINEITTNDIDNLTNA